MVRVGDQIRLSSMKGPEREGVVTAVTGSLIRVRWPFGGETTLVPAPGTLTVVGAKADPQTAASKPRAAKSTAGKAKKTGASKSATPKKKGAANKTTGAKRPQR